ncbi:hypothetical protein GF374_01415 [Candidatus Woesearchaeota archaeon]|nr:hypothetical protein [Candidatus Woesearchaeota archaeon]
MKKINFFEVLFWIFIILGFILLVWFILGSSPLIDQILTMFLVGILTKLYADVRKIGERVARLEGKFDSEISNLKDKFKK